MYYVTNQKIRTTTAVSVMILLLMLFNLPLTAQDDMNQMPQQEQMPPQEQAPGQDEMAPQEQAPNPQDLMPQQQQSVNVDFSEDELKQFIDANKEATKVQQETQQEMVAVIEGEGLDVQTFNEIMTTHQDPQQEAEVSDDEMEKFNKAAEKIMEIQQSMETEVVGAIESTGMDVNKYSEIMLAYQSSPQVQEKVHKLIESEGQGN